MWDRNSHLKQWCQQRCRLAQPTCTCPLGSSPPSPCPFRPPPSPRRADRSASAVTAHLRISTPAGLSVFWSTTCQIARVFRSFFFFFFLIRFRFDAVTVLVWYTLYKYMIMNIIICCQKSVFIHTGSSFSNSRARWVLLSTFYIIIQKITTHQNVRS